MAAPLATGCAARLARETRQRRGAAHEQDGTEQQGAAVEIVIWRIRHDRLSARCIGHLAAIWKRITCGASNYGAAWNPDYTPGKKLPPGWARSTGARPRPAAAGRRRWERPKASRTSPLPTWRLGNQLAQQLVVELVAGLVATELADQAVAE